jgi:hypothetical protein
MKAKGKPFTKNRTFLYVTMVLSVLLLLAGCETGSSVQNNPSGSLNPITVKQE